MSFTIGLINNQGNAISARILSQMTFSLNVFFEVSAFAKACQTDRKAYTIYKIYLTQNLIKIKRQF